MTAIASGATVGTRESCKCDHCVECCERRPGWMTPGEAEKIAAFLGLTLEECFREHLGVDYWIGEGFDGGNINVLSPKIVGMNWDIRRVFLPNGRCTFLKKGRCSIHAVKPFECREAWCGDGPVERSESAHKKAADAWNTAEGQAQIAQLVAGRRRKTAGRRSEGGA